MTQDLIPARPAGTPVEPVAPGQLAWLESELTSWRAAGIVDDEQARTIRARYVAVQRLSLTRLLIFLGGAFLGVGLLWLVASNLDALPPLSRFLAVTMLWLGLVVAAEVLAERRAHRASPGSDSPSPLVGAFRLLAAMGFGAVVFQAAQSLQVPAYEPVLVGVWGLGALAYAYAVGGVTPLLVGIVTTTAWYVWEVIEDSQDGMSFVLPLLLAGVVASAIGAAHAARWRRRFASLWRETSAVLILLGLFVAAFPTIESERFDWSPAVVLGLLVCVVAVAGSVALGDSRGRLENLAPVLAVGAGVLLVLWAPPNPVEGVVVAEGYAHAVVSVAVYVIAAGWYAVLGVVRDSRRLTFIATAALVLFTTVQSFAVFAPIISGATLFLVLGAIFLGSGYLFDRGRRHVVANLEGVAA